MFSSRVLATTTKKEQKGALTVAVDIRLEEGSLGHAPRYPLPRAEGDVLFERDASRSVAIALVEQQLLFFCERGGIGGDGGVDEGEYAKRGYTTPDCAWVLPIAHRCSSLALEARYQRTSAHD